MASYILKNGYDCEVDKIPGTTMPLLTALGKGDIHVLMEVWKQNLEDAWGKLESSGEATDLGVNIPDAIQGWFIPKYLLEEYPDLRKVKDLPKFKKLFTDPEAPSKGRFYNCPLGWSCEDVNSKKFTAYKLLNDFTNFKPGTGAALSAVIASKYKKKEPFVAYYWGPTWILGKYDLFMLEEPKFDQKIWDNLVSGRDLSKAVEYPVVPVHIGANTEWVKNNPKPANFLKNYETSTKLTSRALAFMQDKKGRTSRDAAINFLKTKKEVWSPWIKDPSVIKKIEEKLNISNQAQKTWKLDIGSGINDFINLIVIKFGDSFKAASYPVLQLIIFIEYLLTIVPWYILSLLIFFIPFKIGKRKLAFGVLLSLGFIQALGLWSLSMQTLALMIISTIVSAVIGLPLGILCSRNNKFRSFYFPYWMPCKPCRASFILFLH